MTPLPNDITDITDAAAPAAALPKAGAVLRTLLSSRGELRLSIHREPLSAPGSDEVLIRVEAAALNPSDIGQLLGPADPSTARIETGDGGPELTLSTQPTTLAHFRARWDLPLTAGNEGAGRVIAAGNSPAAQVLLGRRVATLAGGLYAQYRCVPAAQCLVLPEGLEAAEGASALVNPLTTLCMLDTARRHGHRALIHTAAASSVGLMLLKLCQVEDLPLVNVVRNAAQAESLRRLGAAHVCDSSAADFRDALLHAVVQTGATLAFDAVAGGDLADTLFDTMEAACQARATAPSPGRYGSGEMKRVYLYGNLDRSPTVLRRRFGPTWQLSGWLMSAELARIGPGGVAVHHERIRRGLRDVFATHYLRAIGLSDLLDPSTLLLAARMGTGRKLLIEPQRG